MKHSNFFIAKKLNNLPYNIKQNSKLEWTSKLNEVLACRVNSKSINTRKYYLNSDVALKTSASRDPVTIYN